MGLEKVLVLRLTDCKGMWWTVGGLESRGAWTAAREEVGGGDAEGR